LPGKEVIQMKVQVQRLREALEFLGPAVPKKPTLQVLTNVLLKDGWAVANDLEVAVALEFPEAEEQCLIPFHRVADLLKRVPWNEVLTLEQKGTSLCLAWSSGKATYDTHDPQDYPPFPKVEAAVEQVVDGDTLVPALLSVAEYCATDKERPVLTGVVIMLGEPIQVAAGDGFRMAHQILPISLPAAEGIGAVIIPASAVRLLGRLWGKVPRSAPLESGLVPLLTARKQLELALGGGHLQARCGPMTLGIKLIEGTPPNFLQLIPAEPPLKVEVFATDLERAARQVGEVAREGSAIIRLAWSESSMAVSARDGDNEMEVSIPVTSEGGDGRVALNVNYLLEYLRGREGMVTLGVTNPESPVVFRHGASPVVICMPMFVQW